MPRPNRAVAFENSPRPSAPVSNISRAGFPLICESSQKWPPAAVVAVQSRPAIRIDHVITGDYRIFLDGMQGGLSNRRRISGPAGAARTYRILLIVSVFLSVKKRKEIAISDFFSSWRTKVAKISPDCNEFIEIGESTMGRHRLIMCFRGRWPDATTVGRARLVKARRYACNTPARMVRCSARMGIWLRFHKRSRPYSAKPI